MEKLNQSNESSQNFEAEPKLPQIETVHLATFEELHDYTVGDVFLSPIFEVKIPNFLFFNKTVAIFRLVWYNNLSYFEHL